MGRFSFRNRQLLLLGYVRAMLPSPDSLAPDKPSGLHEGDMAPFYRHNEQDLWTRTEEVG
jgi:hypothetical protein